MSGKELKEKVYFCGSIRAGRERQPIYEAMAKHLSENYGPVLTQHVADKVQKCDVAATEKEIHDRDIAWLKECTSVVAECTLPSLGVGYELAFAVWLDKPTLILFCPSEGKRLSAMIAGQEKFTVCEYNTLEEGIAAIDAFYAKLRAQKK